MTTHVVCVVAAIHLLTTKVYKPSTLYLFIYVATALLIASMDKIHNTSAMLIVVSLSCLVQRPVILLMIGSLSVRMITLPYVLLAI